MAGYEELRRQALYESRNHAGLGMVLLLRQGMGAWMKAWLESTRTVLDPGKPPANAGTFIPDACRTQMVVILAAMALSRWQEQRV